MKSQLQNAVNLPAQPAFGLPAEAFTDHIPEKLPGVLEAVPVAVFACEADGCLRWYNSNCQKLWGHAPRRNDPAWRYGQGGDIYYPDGTPMAPEDSPMARALLTGRAVADAEAMMERADGTLIAVSIHAKPIMDEADQVAGSINCLHEITRQKRAEDRQKALCDELNHRVKNSLATVQAIIGQSLQTAPDTERAYSAMLARLMALTRAHDLLTARHWEGVQLDAVLDCALAAACPGPRRYTLKGPAVQLAPKPALALSMAAHELSMNAVEHGALARCSGHVSVYWGIVGGDFPRLRLHWCERNGSRTGAPARKGFGTRLLEQGLPAELDGRVALSYPPSGMTCRIDVPLSRLGAAGA